MSTRTSVPPTKKDFAIHISEISLPTGSTLTPPIVIRESPHGIAEGSHIIKKGAFYYLFTAEGGTEQGHQEWVFRSSEGVFGPWEEKNDGGPLWYNGPEEEVQRTGHVDVFEGENGEWWAVLLGVRPVRGSDGDGKGWLEPQLGRETFLVKVEWVNDWPVFNGGKNVGISTEGPKGAVQAPKPKVWKADLTKEALELGWYEKSKLFTVSTNVEGDLTRSRHALKEMLVIDGTAWLVVYPWRMLRPGITRSTDNASQEANRFRANLFSCSGF